MKRLSAALAIVGLLVAAAACFYDFDRPAPPHDAGAPPIQTQPTGTVTSPPVEGGPPIEAGPLDCPSQDVAWAVDGSTCSAPSGDLLLVGGSRLINDSTLEATGSVTITCTGGTFGLDGGVCEPPHLFDVNSATGCGTGYCMAAIQCGVGDPGLAKTYCVLHGYADQTAFATGKVANGTRQCSPSGGGCFNSQNQNCNVVFTTITCRH